MDWLRRMGGSGERTAKCCFDLGSILQNLFCGAPQKAFCWGKICRYSWRSLTHIVQWILQWLSTHNSCSRGPESEAHNICFWWLNWFISLILIDTCLLSCKIEKKKKENKRSLDEEGKISVKKWFLNQEYPSVTYLSFCVNRMSKILWQYCSVPSLKYLWLWHF